MALRATITNYAQAIEIVKEMNVTGGKWEEEDWRVNGLYKRGLTCEGVEVICVDGGTGHRASRHPRSAMLGTQNTQYHGQGEEEGRGVVISRNLFPF